VWLSEAIIGGLVLIVSLVAWVSLALADLGVHSLAAVVATTAVVAALAIAVAAATAAFAASATAGGVRGRRMRIRADPAGLVMTAGVAALASFLFFPGFAYGAADKDPGVYVAHGMAIARTGGYSLVDPASDSSRRLAVEMAASGARFPGVWISHDDVIVPQFYALWPALLATAWDLGGEHVLIQVGPLCGLLAVCTWALLVRRAVAEAIGGAAGLSCGLAGPSDAAARLSGRVAGLFAGASTGVLLATNMLEVWQAKYPSSEISAQLFFAAALFGVVLALATGSWLPAAAAGVVAGIGLLDRADGTLPLLLAAATGAVLVAVRRFDRRAVAFAVGLAVVLPHALWQAYSPDANRDYTLVNGIPNLTTVAGLVATLFAAGLLTRPVVRLMIIRWAARCPNAIGDPNGDGERARSGRSIDRYVRRVVHARTPSGRARRDSADDQSPSRRVARTNVGGCGAGASHPERDRRNRRDPRDRRNWRNRRDRRNRRLQLALGAAVLMLVAGLFTVAVLRGRLFGADYAVFESVGRQRTYDEQSLQRLAWFVSWAAFLLAFAGLAVIALRRWNAMLWAVALSTLPLLAVYAWHTHNSVRLMWWARRYVPVALPGLLALAGIALGVALAALVTRRRSVRSMRFVRFAVGLPALVALGGLLFFALPQSLPLRHHDEMGGSFTVTAELAALADGRTGVYLWPRAPCCLTATDLFPGALWLGRGELSALLPAAKADWARYVGDFRRGFPGSPLFVIGSDVGKPDIPGVDLVAVRHIVASLPFWEESETSRPDRGRTIPVDFIVWQVRNS